SLPDRSSQFGGLHRFLRRCHDGNTHGTGSEFPPVLVSANDESSPGSNAAHTGIKARFRFMAATKPAERRCFRLRSVGLNRSLFWRAKVIFCRARSIDLIGLGLLFRYNLRVSRQSTQILRNKTFSTTPTKLSSDWMEVIGWTMTVVGFGTAIL